MKRILIITSDFDKTVDYFFRKYKNKADIFIFNVNRFTEYKIHIDNVNGERSSETET